MRSNGCTPQAGAIFGSKTARRAAPGGIAAGGIIVAGLILGTAGLCPAAAQVSPGSNYHTQTMNYDLWCQWQAGLPAERCDKRLPQDVKVFEAYRAKVEQFEIPYLQRKNEEARINRDILHSDPIDNPLTDDPARQRQDPYQPPLHSPP